MGNMWSAFLGSHTPRSVALLILIAIPLGNLLFESLELLVAQTGLSGYFVNGCILVIGLLGIISFGIALLCRRNLGNNTSLGKRRRNLADNASVD